ncbi:microfibrillar-associated protein 1 [Engraulis encrasicolus]|uniref:microfibrillar-associated protein 1 n=1 Tax=Engraulis encrasicolus TaxID=184585 RepID=UPI002FD2A770
MRIALPLVVFLAVAGLHYASAASLSSKGSDGKDNKEDSSESSEEKVDQLTRLRKIDQLMFEAAQQENTEGKTVAPSNATPTPGYGAAEVKSSEEVETAGDQLEAAKVSGADSDSMDTPSAGDQFEAAQVEEAKETKATGEKSSSEEDSKEESKEESHYMGAKQDEDTHEVVLEESTNGMKNDAQETKIDENAGNDSEGDSESEEKSEAAHTSTNTRQAHDETTGDLAKEKALVE